MDSTVRRTQEDTATLVPNTTNESDGRGLLLRIATRDRRAMRDFYLMYHRPLTRFLGSIAAHREVVEQIVEDVFMAVWQRAAEFSGDQRVCTWVMGIAWRQALKSIRLEEYMAAYGTDPPGLDTDDFGNRPPLERAMNTLSGYERALIELAYVGGYSCEEIGFIMVCPASIVRTRLFDARLRLRVALDTRTTQNIASASLDSPTPEAWPTQDHLSCAAC